MPSVPAVWARSSNDGTLYISYDSAADAVYWVTVAGCIVFRYISVARRDGYTLSGEPATLSHWRWYTVIFTLVALILWGGAHLIAYRSA